MKISLIDARDLPEAWFLCLREVLSNGYEYKIDRGSYAGQSRKELDMVVVQIKHPGSLPLIPNVPQGVPPPTSMEYIESYLPYIMTAQKGDGEQYTYGQDLEVQIAEVIKMYRKDGHNTNQAYMAVGGGQSIFLSDPQCLRGVDTRIRYGKLHFVIYFRSWDLWGGFPSNMAALQLLKKYMADEIGVEDGEMIAMSKGMHLYDHTWDVARIACSLPQA